MSPISVVSNIHQYRLGLIKADNDKEKDADNYTDIFSLDTLRFLAAGKSGAVYGIDSERVLKVFYAEDEGGEIERRVYQRLGSHPNVATLLGIRTDGSIILEHGDSLRTICRASSTNEIPLQTKVRWLIHAAEGYQYLHSRGITHADVGCGNLILMKNDCVKLIDFEGCSIDGGPAGSCYEWFSYCPSTPRVSRSTDIFAFGCAVYEALTGRPPHHELEASDNKYREVEELYTNKNFPDIAKLPLGQLIQRCWNSDFSSMEEVVQELNAFRPGFFERKKLRDVQIACFGLT